MYDHKKIEKKWQAFWKAHNTFTANNDSSKEKKYILVEFPYPSGEGLHMGHLRPYTAGDVTSRFYRHQGFETLFPMGWDAFGLPAENYAIKKGVHPRISTEKNVQNAKAQLESWGMSFDWNREINTTDPSYYRWTQWIFLQFFKAGLAYEATGLINWCPKDKTGLANEEVIDGKCERCGSEVEKKELRQWYLKITAYAEKLLEGLKELPEWPEPVKLQQSNWIGKSQGAEIEFKVVDQTVGIKVFTTRADTLYSGTFLVLAPDHPLIDTLTTPEQKKLVQKYREETTKKTDIERTSEHKDKTGVFTGSHAINPASGDHMPIWIADFVLANYGTGAVFADAHDERDFDFAKKYNIPLKTSIKPLDSDDDSDIRNLEKCFTGKGTLYNSGTYSGLTSEEAIQKIGAAFGTLVTKYKLRDWVFSRQRYWGEPIPLIHCEHCGIVAVPEQDLPVTLPEVEKYEPTGTGESPLATIESWVKVPCPSCGTTARRETNTMPQWAGSSWYYLRYIDPQNTEVFADQTLQKHWLPVDIYFGGMEHTTLHLLYSRFWNLFLFDQKQVPVKEPYTKRVPHGIILGPDGEKMSKSRGNVVNPNEVVEHYGADTLRMYELFLGPHDQTVSWSDQGIIGIRRFLERVWRLYTETIPAQKSPAPASKELLGIIHKAIKKITGDIPAFQFNTAISALMVCSNGMYEYCTQHNEAIPQELKDAFLVLLSPFAPHIAEELWNRLGHTESLSQQKWPEYDPALTIDDMITLVVQINGKMRDSITIPATMNESDIRTLALERPSVQKWIEGYEIKKMIYVAGRLINIVVS